MADGSDHAQTVNRDREPWATIAHGYTTLGNGKLLHYMVRSVQWLKLPDKANKAKADSSNPAASQAAVDESR